MSQARHNLRHDARDKTPASPRDWLRQAGAVLVQSVRDPPLRS